MSSSFPSRVREGNTALNTDSFLGSQLPATQNAAGDKPFLREGTQNPSNINSVSKRVAWNAGRRTSHRTRMKMRASQQARRANEKEAGIRLFDEPTRKRMTDGLNAWRATHLTKMICEHPEREHKAFGLCDTCYQRQRRDTKKK